MKKLFTILMSVFLLVSGLCFPTSPVVEEAHAATPWGIDVSEHQGRIDWDKVKASGCSFAILRCGYGQDQAGQDDDYWEYNASECERVGMPYGVYLYSYAKNTTAAKGEADHVLRLIKGKNLSYPVYYDLEESSQAALGATALGNIATAFCDKIEAAGYSVGVYANTSWWNNYLTSSVFNNWYKWVAQYNSTCTYKGRYEIWQCTDSWTVDGISGRVDGNYQYSDVSGSTVIDESLETNKTTYEQGEAIYVTASTAKSDAWVAIYGAGDTISSATPSYYWYWVNGTDTEYGHGGTWIRGQSYNIYDGICSHRVLDGSMITGTLPSGTYKVVILYDDYKVLQSKTITIGDGKAPSMEVSKSSFALGEDIRVKAYSTKNNAWVGLFQGSDPAYGTGSFIYYYYTASHNDTYVSMQDVGECNVDHAYKSLPAGTYTLTLFGDDGYGQIDATKTITITNADAGTTDKTTYKPGESIYVTASSESDGSWVGLYKSNETPSSSIRSMYWYYIKSSADGIDRSGQTIDLTDDYYFNTERNEALSTGDYKIVIFGDSGYDNILKTINITIASEKTVTNTVEIPATCTTAGSLTTYYSDGTSTVETIPALGHRYTSKMTAQTCTERGYTTYTCVNANCGHSYVADYVDATGHYRPDGVKDCQQTNCTACSAVLAPSKNHEPGEAASCKAEQICTVCNEVLAEKTDHTPGEAATCTTPQICTVCKIELNPVANHTPGEAATCTTPQICTVCKTELAPAKNHKVEAGKLCTDDHKCTQCGETFPGAASHTPGPAATCDTPQTCTVCSYELAQAKGHTMADADCENPKTCTRTGCGYTEGEALGHDPVTDEAVEPGCVTTGLTEGSHCSVCKKVLVEQTVVPVAGHSWVAASCEMPKHCIKCSASSGTPAGHAWKEGEVTKEPTCTENGERTDTCKRGCGETNKVTLPPTGHRYIGTVTEPTCTEDGYTTYHCHNEGCNSSYTKIDEGSACHTPGPEATCTAPQTCTVEGCGAVLKGALAHIPGPAPTCTEMQTCTVCNTILKGATGHKPGPEATCTAPQTCTVEGCGFVFEEKKEHTPGPAATCLEPQTCTECDYIFHKAVGHTPGAEATCTTPQKCKVCHITIQSVLGHSSGPAATCDTPQTCTECHAVLAPATGHTVETVPGYSATCTKEGLSDGRVCITCGEVFAAGTRLSKTAHSFVTVTKAATMTEDGLVEKKCETCGAVAESKTIARAATVKLSFSKGVYSGKQKNPKVNIYDSDGRQVSEEFYTVETPSGRTKVGEYVYTVTFKGDYEGTKELKLTVKPKKPIAKKPVEGKKAVTVKWKKVSAQTTGYQVVIAGNKAFTQNVKKSFVKGYKKTSKKMTGLKANKTYYVKVRAYKTVNIGGKNTKIYSNWSVVKTVKTK